MKFNKIAQQLDEAACKAEPIRQISLEQAISLDEAYAIQSLSLCRRYQRGENRIGMKLGFTSRAKMEQMGVHDMIWGRLTDRMFYQNGSTLHIDRYIHPRAEPEIAFRLSRPLDQPLNLSTATQFIDAVAVAIEIIDSRYENFKFSLEDVVADNCSSAAYTVGEWKPGGAAVADLAMALLIDGKVVQSGNSNAILGNPLESLIAAARLATGNGETLPEGSVILAGAATAAVYLKAGQRVEARAEGLGSVHLQVS